MELTQKTEEDMMKTLSARTSVDLAISVKPTNKSKCATKIFAANDIASCGSMLLLMQTKKVI